MRTATLPSLTPLARPLAILAVAALLGACAGDAPLGPGRSANAPVLAQGSSDANQALATLRMVTAKYHDLDAAIADGFVFLHGCEVREDGGSVGTVYVHLGRLLDGAVDASAPDALIYEPRANGKPKLVGVELAVPYPLWTAPEPPSFLGNSFDEEDEFGVWALHAWVWGNNPAGMFAESNPKVSCGEE